MAMPEPIVPAPMTAMRRMSRGFASAAIGCLALSRSAKNWWRSAKASRETRRRWKTARSLARPSSMADRGRGHDGVDGGLDLRPAFAGLQRGARGLGNGDGIRCRHCAVTQALLAASQLARVGHGGGAQVALRFGVDQAGRKGRSAADTLAAADHADGARDAHDARQALRAARAGDDAQGHFRQAHHRARRCDARVTTQGQLEAAAQGRAAAALPPRACRSLRWRGSRRAIAARPSGWPNSRRSEPAMKVLPAPMSTAPLQAGIGR